MLQNLPLCCIQIMADVANHYKLLYENSQRFIQSIFQDFNACSILLLYACSIIAIDTCST